jgi:hypothetical protein
VSAHNLDEETVAAIVAEAVYRQLRARLAALSVEEAAPVSTARLYAYARRNLGSPADLALEQALRREPAVARRYRHLLSGVAIAASPTAIAAASGRYPERQIGSWRLRVVEEHDAIYIVLSANSPDAAAAPEALDLQGADGGERLELSPPVRGHITVLLDRNEPRVARILSLLADTSCALYLL